MKQKQSAERRKVYIEFLSRNEVTFVTPFVSRAFKLSKEDDGCMIDLVTLKKKKSEDDLNFYALFNVYEHEDLRNSLEYSVDLYVRSDSSYFKRIGTVMVDIDSNKKVFEVSYKI